MDGTLIDSEIYWQTAETRLFESLGEVWKPEISDQLAGRSLVDAIGIMSAATGVDLDPASAIEFLINSVHQQVSEGGAPWLPGALETLQLAKTLGVKTALVTSSYRQFTQSVVDQAFPGAFDAVVCGDEVKYAKPHPEPFLKAAELLNVEITECMAFEDSPSGSRAAIASGALTCIVPGVNPVPSGLDALYIEGLKVITAEWLENTWSNHRK
ncbi:HAD hydrolase, family IA, variant 3 [Gleimia coleocanis DSM 15436]|uniref:HAD hydrolase, family IA, variant 3 n=2 Tax=Gleimia TaxID=2692113 RepID=C0W0L2_9ACTO|nr:HAD hydrolase, family IA, variant 3 [Gleimia coleocanis DSM 15436]